VYFLPLILILPPLFGITGVQITQPVSDILSFLTCIPFLYFFMKKLNRLEKEQLS
ncbi:MAG TPA: MATE family efflux transporter, partial [Synergistaceae bacterium]|nr:MATE family efflux transporter [Synergistaceae bacterium]